MVLEGAAVLAPDRWKRVVAMAVPPGPALASGFFSYDQIKKSFYLYFFRHPRAEVVVGVDPWSSRSIAAHAWVEHHGRRLARQQGSAGSFSELARLRPHAMGQRPGG